MQPKFTGLTLASAMAALAMGLLAAERASAAGTGALSAQPIAVAQATATDKKAANKKESKPAAATKSSPQKAPAGETTVPAAAPAAPAPAAATAVPTVPAPAAAVAAAAATTAAAAAAAPAQPNPAETLAQGKKLAMDRASGNCIACHMIPGGESPGTIGPPLVAMQVRYPSKDKLREQIWDATKANPASAMPPFGKNQVLTEQQINQVVEFVWSL